MFVVAVLATAAAVSPKADASPVEWLKTQVEEARRLADRRVSPNKKTYERWESEAKEIIDGILDWDALTKRSLGRQWARRSRSEQKRFSELLRKMINASYESKLRSWAQGEDNKKKAVIRWSDERIEADKAFVTARVKTGRTHAELEFKLHSTPKGWKVYDVAIDEVSTIRTYRSQFRKLIRQEGFPQLLARMRKKIEDLEAGRGDLNPSG